MTSISAPCSVALSCPIPGVIKTRRVPGSNTLTWPNSPINPCIAKIRVQVASFSRSALSSLIDLSSDSFARAFKFHFPLHLFDEFKIHHPVGGKRLFDLHGNSHFVFEGIFDPLRRWQSGNPVRQGSNVAS